MTEMLRIFVAALAVFLLSAAGCPKPPPAPPAPVDAGIEDAPPRVSCVVACQHVIELGCQTNGSCSIICNSLEDYAFNACLLTAVDCYDADRCDR